MIEIITFKVRDNGDSTDRWELRYEKRQFPKTINTLANLPKNKRLLSLKFDNADPYIASFGHVHKGTTYFWIHVKKQNNTSFKTILLNNNYRNGDEIVLQVNDDSMTANVMYKTTQNISRSAKPNIQRKMKSELITKTAEDAKLTNIIDMALDFAVMMRIFEKATKTQLKEKLIRDLTPFSKITTEVAYQQFHDDFCNWGIMNCTQTQKTNKKTGKIIKPSCQASYGQMAKILDVVLHVYVYYAQYPNSQQAQLISKWLNPALDNKMMKFLKRQYSKDIAQWPSSIEQVDKTTYLLLQKVVRKFIQEKRHDDILPIQFDDIYWEALNRKFTNTLSHSSQI